MTRSLNRRFISMVILLAALVLQTAHAEELVLSSTVPGLLSVQLPDVDREALVEQIRVLRSQLIQRKQALLKIVTDRELDGGDALITAIMPGGLLYAGFKKIRYEQAKNDLASASADIEEYTSDLLAMQSGPAAVVVAMQH